MRLVTPTPIGPVRDLMIGFEATTTRLRESMAILYAINAADLMADLPPGAAGVNQQCATSLMAVLERELEAIVATQEGHLREL